MSKSPSLRRIQADIRELALDPSDRYHAAPLESDMFEWHFTIRGADGTDFEGGVYHGRIMLPPEYPFKPPHIIFLTPSGRFETNTKVCLSFSAYHPELWQPAWGIRLILEALISFLPTPADGAIGALDWTSAERKRLAQKSVNYHCPTCGCKAIDLLPKLKPKTEEGAKSSTSSRFQKEIEKLRQWQSMEHGEEEGGDQKEKENQDDKKKNETTAKDDATYNKVQDAEVVVSQDTAPADDKANKMEDQEEPKNTQEYTEAPPSSSFSRDYSDVDRMCKEDPDRLRRELLQDTPAPSKMQSEKFQQQRIRQYYEKKAAEQRAEKENVEQNANNQAAATAAGDAQERVEPFGHLQETTVHQNEPQQPEQQQQQQQMDAPLEDGTLSWMVDPVLHGIIVTLAVLCFLLLRKLQALMEELDELNQVLDG